MILLEEAYIKNKEQDLLFKHIYESLKNDMVYSIPADTLYEGLNKSLNHLCDGLLLESDSEGDWNLYLPTDKFDNMDYDTFVNKINEGLDIRIKDFIRPLTSADGPTIVSKNGKKFIMSLIKNNGVEEVGYVNIADKNEVYTKKEVDNML